MLNIILGSLVALVVISTLLLGTIICYLLAKPTALYTPVDSINVIVCSVLIQTAWRVGITFGSAILFGPFSVHMSDIVAKINYVFFCLLIVCGLSQVIVRHLYIFHSSMMDSLLDDQIVTLYVLSVTFVTLLAFAFDFKFGFPGGLTFKLLSGDMEIASMSHHGLAPSYAVWFLLAFLVGFGIVSQVRIEILNHLDSQWSKRELHNHRFLIVSGACIVACLLTAFICLRFVLTPFVQTAFEPLIISLVVNFVNCTLLPLFIILRTPNMKSWLGNIFSRCCKIHRVRKIRVFPHS